MPEPTIDERLKAIAESVELLTRDVHEMQKATKHLDARERQARQALLTAMTAGVSAYFEALQKNGDGEPEA
jgi:hypothetical protein